MARHGGRLPVRVVVTLVRAHLTARPALAATVFLLTRAFPPAAWSLVLGLPAGIAVAGLTWRAASRRG